MPCVAIMCCFVFTSRFDVDCRCATLCSRPAVVFMRCLTCSGTWNVEGSRGTGLRPADGWPS
eukprot:4867775-Prymnesium_polylepis.1